MSSPQPPGASPREATPDAVIAAALRHAADVTDNARAVFQGVHDKAGTLVDLRILYGNAAFWVLVRFDPASATGRGMAELAPTIDWNAGVAGRLFAAMASGQSFADRNIRFLPQIGSHAGQERVFEIAFTVSDDVLAADWRDTTSAVLAAEALRNAALARFLRAAVDPAIERSELMQTLAAELAEMIGNLCVIIEQAPDGVLRMVAVAGGPGDTAARMIAILLGRPIPIPEPVRQTYMTSDTLFHSPIPPNLREAMAGSMSVAGLPDELAATANSVIGAAVSNGSGQPIGRIHMWRFDGDAPYTREDQTTVEAIASAATLVLERRAAEDGLATSLARFEALFEQAPVPMVVVGSDRTVRLNEAAIELYGREQDEMSRLSFQPNAPWIPDDQAEVWRDARVVAAGERVIGARFVLVRPNGERREVEGSSIPITGADGARSGVVTVLNDVTDRLSLEAQFRQAQKMEALGRLAGGIAHDFNNVLMATLGYAEFVVRDARAGKLVNPDHAAQVVAATRRAIELTARLTSFARREPARREPVDVGESVGSVLPLINRLAPESIEIVTHLEPGSMAMLDRSEFEQALLNLIVNAVDAMPGSGRLTLEVGEVDLDPDRASSHLGESAGRQVLVAVSDTGVGMDEATRSRIFEPFYTTKGVGEGTGLGLAMVFAAVERADGRIWVYSEPGHGTTFKIYLPLAEPVPPELDGGAGPRATAAGGSESILLLEDDGLVRDLLETVLRGLGYEVTVAARPSEALAAASGRRFDLLVSDVVMPEMMGNEVAARLREAQPRLSVVFMSGYTANALRFELGPRDSLAPKPLAPNEVARVVREALDRAADD